MDVNQNNREEQAMAGPLTQEQKNQALFMHLVIMFQSAAMQQMGKVMNPITKEIERDLEQAQWSIDLLTMLQEKTKGNLSDEENRFLDHVLFELRMNYVDEANKPPPEEKKEEKPNEEPKAEEPPKEPEP